MNKITRAARPVALTIFAALVPAMAIAQTDFATTPLGGTINIVKGALNLFLASAIAIATALFFWNVIKFIKSADNAEAQKGAKKALLYSGGALFAMVGIWTLISYFVQSLGIAGTDIDTVDTPTITVPQIN